MAPPRPFAERKQRALALLVAPEADAWVATASPDGQAHLVPLSIGWTGASIVLVTLRSSPTARNMPVAASVRVALGGTREVVLIEAEVVAVHSMAAAPDLLAKTFAQQSGWNAAEQSDADRYELFELRPRLLQAWREANEITGRTLMRDGIWLDPS
jgi:hypothetical protein